MTFHLKRIVAVLSLSGMSMSALFAITTESDAKAMQMQLASLQREVNTLKLQLQGGQQGEAQQGKQKIRKKAKGQSGSAKIDTSSSSQSAGQPMRGRDLVKMIREEKEYLPFDLDVPGQAFVSTGPYVGVPIQYSGSNLVVNTPSVNTDVQLLNMMRFRAV